MVSRYNAHRIIGNASEREKEEADSHGAERELDGGGQTHQSVLAARDYQKNDTPSEERGQIMKRILIFSWTLLL